MILKLPILNDKGGHIGYGIAPKFRKKGYETKMLELGLIEAKNIGLDKVSINYNIDILVQKKSLRKTDEFLKD